MKVNLSDKIVAWFALLSGLTISAVAIWYSVAGLVSIFSAAMIPIIVMGVVLEISKLIATVWLKLNWNRAPIFIRSYLLVAIAILMVITSMGIFGFLSKAHSDQSLVSGDVQAKIAVYDDKIKSAKDNIDANRKALKQMDEAVDQVMARSSSETGADKAVAIRRAQQKERARLQSEIAAEQKIITAVSEERAPIAAEVRKVEAEVGPIKYIAAFIYGDNPDANILEKAVTWVIIIIVSVFDPLAVILLLASQYSFQWFRKAREEEEDLGLLHKTVPAYEPDNGPLTEGQVEQIKETVVLFERDLVAEGNAAIAELEPEVPEFELPEEKPSEELVKVVQEDKTKEVEADDDEIPDTATEHEKIAMSKWKREHPDSSLKLQRRLLAQGRISVLPWEQYLEATPDFQDDDDAKEAAKWAAEQVEAKKKSNIVDGTIREDAGREKIGLAGYKQNAEQNESTLWQRIKKIDK
jgi:hypothetical protein